MKLNTNQQQAIEYTDSPCLVLAGAGSGKTKVITHKIVHLIKHCGYLSKNIFAVTFTNKAAREMKERMATLLSKKEIKGLSISTFHTLGLNIIKAEYRHLNLKASFSLFDEHDVFNLLKELTENTLNNEKTAIKNIMSRISLWKNQAILPDKATQIAQNEIEKYAAEIYLTYQNSLKNYNVVDFDDLILLPTILLSNNPLIAKKWQEKIQYLLIDEYQDTNSSQYTLMKSLIGNTGQLTVVGDDDQSIYSWRGANPQILDLLQQDFPDLKVIKLELNYRSTAKILNSANILIANNPHSFPKKLYSKSHEGEKVQVIEADNEHNEVEKLINTLLKHKALHESQYQDYAILYRGNHQSTLYEKALMLHRIPYKISGATSFFAQREIKDILSYLKLLINPEDDASFLRICNVPKRGIGNITLQHLGLLANQKKISLFSTCFEPEIKQLLAKNAFIALTAFSRWILQIRDYIDKGKTLLGLQIMLKDMNYESHLLDTCSSPKTAEWKMKNISTLYKWITNMIQGDDINEAMTLHEVVHRFTLRDLMENNKMDENNNQIQLMTLHASKGLEFPYVFLIGVEEGILPHQSSIDNNDVEEERRLMYVGITRAMHALFLIYCKKRTQLGELIHCEPSRFLLELPQDDLLYSSKQKTTQKEKNKSMKNNLAMIRAQLKRHK